MFLNGVHETDRRKARGKACWMGPPESKCFTHSRNERSTRLATLNQQITVWNTGLQGQSLEYTSIHQGIHMALYEGTIGHGTFSPLKTQPFPIPFLHLPVVISSRLRIGASPRLNNPPVRDRGTRSRTIHAVGQWRQFVLGRKNDKVLDYCII